jgi:hypothetical protein
MMLNIFRTKKDDKVDVQDNRQRMLNDLGNLERDEQNILAPLEEAFELAKEAEKGAFAVLGVVREELRSREEKFNTEKHRLHKEIHRLRQLLNASAPESISCLANELRMTKGEIIRDLRAEHVYDEYRNITITEVNIKNVQRAQKRLEDAIQEVEGLGLTSMDESELDNRLSKIKQKVLVDVRKELLSSPEKIKREGHWYMAPPVQG